MNTCNRESRSSVPRNVRPNRFEPRGLLFISPAFHARLVKSRVLPGDVVVVRSGSVGTACVIPDSLGEANCSDLVLIQSPLVEPHFIAFYMNSAAHMQIDTGKVGVALTHFNTASVASLTIPIPPCDEQTEIVRKVELLLSEADRLATTLETQLEQSSAARQLLLHEAFAGDLVPQDPNDEPASVLLERIRAAKALNEAERKRARRALPSARKKRSRNRSAGEADE